MTDRKVTEAATTLDVRDVRIAAEDAAESLARFGRLSRQWNAPDDEHTRFQMRAVLDAALEEVFADGE